MVPCGGWVRIPYCPEPVTHNKINRDSIYAGMVELADTLDLGSSGEIHAGSSPVTRILILENILLFYLQEIYNDLD